MQNAIETYQLGKRYRRRTGGAARYGSLRDSLQQAFRFSGRAVAADDHFWALRYLDLQVPTGEVMGIIGANGAGKSTLLKVLSRITEPTEGELVLRGRISSLLEVGTGFHPELTGRENIYLSGTILGMRRAEVSRHFDEIVAFAGIADFLDMPVKRYSSGMYVRLGFAVAAHLEAEILLVDEVLAVGDAEFQRKSLGKMDEAASSGRTVLVVSHNLELIAGLCQQTAWLADGKLHQLGPTQEVIAAYLASLEHTHQQAFRTGQVIQGIELLVNEQPATIAHRGDTLTVWVDFATSRAVYHPVLGINIRDQRQLALVGINNRHYNANFPVRSYREGRIGVRFRIDHLLPGTYSVDLFFGDKTGDLEKLPAAFSFRLLAQAGELPVVETLDSRINRVRLPDVEWLME